MFNVEMKHSETEAWVVKEAGFMSSIDAEQYAYDRSTTHTNEYRVVVTKTGKVITYGIKSKH